MRHQLEALMTIFSTAWTVAWRRARHGRLRPSWPYLYEVMALAMKRQFARISQRPWPEQREAWDARAMPDVTSRRTELAHETIAGVSCAIVTRRRDERHERHERTVLLLHGGAYIFGSTKTYREVLGRIALAANARVVMPLYRLAPEHPFPAALDDVNAVYRALVRSEDAARIVVCGDSAGGGLTAATLVRARDEGLPLAAGAILISPWVDLAARGGSLEDNERYDFFSPALVARWADAYRGDTDATEPLVSPARADLHGLPPMLVHVGGAEMILDQVRTFAARARAAGVACTLEEWPDMFHDWHMFASVFGVSAKALARVCEFAVEVSPARARSDT